MNQYTCPECGQSSYLEPCFFCNIKARMQKIETKYPISPELTEQVNENIRKALSGECFEAPSIDFTVDDLIEKYQGISSVEKVRRMREINQDKQNLEARSSEIKDVHKEISQNTRDVRQQTKKIKEEIKEIKRKRMRDEQ